MKGSAYVQQRYSHITAVKAIRQLFKRHENDVGSPEVQIAALTQRIQFLTEHMLNNKHDYSCKRSLVQLVHTRRRHLRYLYRENPEKCLEILGKLKIRFNPEIDYLDHKVRYGMFKNTKNKVGKDVKQMPHIAIQVKQKRPKSRRSKWRKQAMKIRK